MRFAGLTPSLASVILLLAAVGAACSSSNESAATSPDGGATADGGGGGEGEDAAPGADAADTGPLGGDRPVELHVPPGYVAGTATPLVILLHGYSASGSVQDVYFGLTAVSDARGFLYAHPDGLVDADDKRYWNATDACCDFAPSKVDDSTYLSNLIEQIKARYTVDPKRVFLIGHSNGGFMSHRMACDHSDQVAAIVSLAGATLSDPTKCKPSEPVSVLQIHGTADGTIAYEGGALAGKTYPSAKATVASWVGIDGCSTTPDATPPPVDVDSKTAGNETTVTRYGTGCKPGGHVELWTIEGGVHIPSLSKTFATSVVDFLYAHPKP